MVEFNTPTDIPVIRAIYVPWLVLTIHEILFSNHQDFPEYIKLIRNLQESFNLAQLIAKEGEFQLVQSFKDSGKLSMLLEALKDTALASLGYQNQALLWTSQN